MSCWRRKHLGTYAWELFCWHLQILHCVQTSCWGLRPKNDKAPEKGKLKIINQKSKNHGKTRDLETGDSDTHHHPYGHRHEHRGGELHVKERPSLTLPVREGSEEWRVKNPILCSSFFEFKVSYWWVSELVSWQSDVLCGGSNFLDKSSGGCAQAFQGEVATGGLHILKSR